MQDRPHIGIETTNVGSELGKLSSIYHPMEIPAGVQGETVIDG